MKFVTDNGKCELFQRLSVEDVSPRAQLAFGVLRELLAEQPSVTAAVTSAPFPLPVFGMRVRRLAYTGT